MCSSVLNNARKRQGRNAISAKGGRGGGEEEEGGCGIANEAGSSDGRMVVVVTSTAEVSGSNPLFLGLAMRFGVAWKESSEQ